MREIHEMKPDKLAPIIHTQDIVQLEQIQIFHLKKSIFTL